MKLKISPDVSMPLDTVTSTIALLGVRGSGKTHTSSLIAEEMLQNNLHLVIIDPLDVWWGMKSSDDGKNEGYPILIMGGEHGDVPLEPTAGKVVAKLIVEEKLSAILSMKHFSDGEACRFTADFLLEVFRLCKEPLHVIVDEADMFAPQRPMKGSSKEISLHAMDKIVRRGRASGLGVSMMTQRPAVLHKDVLTQAETLIALRILSPQDRGAVEAWIEVHGDKKERDEVLSSLHTLETGTGYVWSPNFLKLFCKTTFRQRRTFDSSATPKVNVSKGRVIVPKKLAQVDLTKIKGMIAATIEKAKLENPTLLKKENARLKNVVVDLEQQVQRRIQEVIALEKRGGPVKITTIKVPAIGARTIKKLEKSLKVAKKLQDKAYTSSNELMSAAALLGGEMAELAGSIREATKKPIEQPPVLESKPILKKGGWNPVASMPKPNVVPTAQSPQDNDAEPLGGSPRKILEILSGSPEALDKISLGIMSGFAPNSGTFSNYLGELTSKGFIKLEGRKYVVVRNFGVIQTPSLHQVREMWMSKLGAERKLLKALFEMGAMNKEGLGSSCGMSAASGTFSNYLGSLTSKGLVSRSPDGVYVAHRLFLE